MRQGDSLRSRHPWFRRTCFDLVDRADFGSLHPQDHAARHLQVPSSGGQHLLRGSRLNNHVARPSLLHLFFCNSNMVFVCHCGDCGAFGISFVRVNIACNKVDALGNPVPDSVAIPNIPQVFGPGCPGLRQVHFKSSDCSEYAAGKAPCACDFISRQESHAKSPSRNNHKEIPSRSPAS